MSKIGTVYNIPITASGGAMYIITTLTQLTEPSSSTSVLCEDYKYHTLQYKIANIDTSVVIRIEGSLDGTNWANLDANGTDTTHTSDGTYIATFDGGLKYIRFTFVSELTLTTATIDVVYMGKV